MLGDRRRRMTQDAAERLALAALGTLVADPERLESFLAATGIGPDTLRAAAGTPAFLVAVLDHLMADERALLVWCGDAEVAPETIAAARELLAAAA